MSIPGNYENFRAFGNYTRQFQSIDFDGNGIISPREKMESRDLRMHERLLNMARHPFRALAERFNHHRPERMHGHHGNEHRHHGHDGHRNFARNESIFRDGFRRPEQRFC